MCNWAFTAVCVRHWAGAKKGGCFAPTGTSVGIVDFPSMVLDGLPSCGAKGMGGADQRWSCLLGGVVR